MQTAASAVERCLLMTTDPGDLVIDPTCGSGTTAFVAEKWGRRWITCDTSRVAGTLAKQRLMTASYDYFELRYPHEGLKGGFIYKTVPHVTLKSIANNPDIDTIYERMHPAVERALGALNAALPPSPAGGRGAGGEGDGSAQAANNLTSLSGRGAGGEGDGSEYIPNPPAQLPEELLRHAREMRKGATDAEHLLWQLLRDRRLANAKFRRQHTIGNYIVDFYCDAHRLVIELDGGQHAEQQSYDAARTAFLEKQGLTVLRYWNNQVLGETEPVLQDIWRHVGGATLTPIPLPPAGEGLREWEVPFDFPADWPEAARSAFDAFHAAQQAMQKQMDLSIAAHADQEILYDQPQASKNKRRITGPFSVEAVPFPSVKGLDALSPGLPSPQPLSQGERGYVMEADASIARSGESARQHTWRDELLKTGIRGKGGQMLKFAELETLPGTKYLHCTGTLVEPVTSLTPGPSPACGRGESMRVVVSFGPEHAALEQRQVEMAMREAGELFPRPKMIVFCAFTFDPEAAKDIDQTKGITALKAQMNTDLLTDDLKKARSSNQSFWLMGQPDVEVRKLPSPPAPLPKGEGSNNWYTVEVHGFDYFDTAKGELVSGGKGKIAMWLLDTDYDERSLFPRQVFFPMAGKGEGWQKLKKDIKAELNEDLLEQFHGTTSLPFAAGENRKIAVKIIDDRGIESLKVVTLEDGK